MTHIVYLIQHLDTDKKYVGITSADLKTRWDQHRNDPNSAVYEALRADGHRMTMEVLEECDTRDQALRREQEYIHELGTAAPRGWNRMVKSSIRATDRFEGLLKRQWPDSYKSKYRIVWHQSNRLPLFTGFAIPKYIGELVCSKYGIVNSLLQWTNTDIFGHQNYHLQYARRIGDRIIHHVLVFNSYDNVYPHVRDCDERIVCCDYVFTGKYWENYNFRTTPFLMNDESLWNERFHSLAYWMEMKEAYGRCFVEEPLFLKDRDNFDLLFRPQYSRGGF